MEAQPTETPRLDKPIWPSERPVTAASSSNDVELSCLGGQKDVERAPPALVRLKERHVAEHLCGLITSQQR